MSKTLILYRHAKSDWADATLTDFDRPLNARGRAAAPVMGQWLNAAGLRPELILCSSSVRTRETLERTGRPLSNRNIDIEFRDDIYEASWTALLAAIRSTVKEPNPATVTTLLMIGHNPGLQQLASNLINTQAPLTVDGFDRKFPTAAIAVLNLPIDSWDACSSGTARLTHYVTPKRLLRMAPTSAFDTGRT
ncbi:MAG: histidine phosphatase family protein [Pseudomonadota bacterium]